MRILALCSLVIAAALALAAPAEAKEPGWCATYRNGGNNCGFNTYEQCMAAIAASAVSATAKARTAEPDKPAARKERKERDAEPKAKRKEKEEVKERVAPKPVPPPAAAQPAPVIVQPPPVAVQPCSLRPRSSRPTISRRRARLSSRENTKPASPR